MSRYIHYLNGHFVTEGKLLISPRDMGFTRSFAVFDYFKTYKGRPFKLKGHIARLLRSAELINLKHDYNLEQLIEVVEELLDKNDDGNEKGVKTILSGGVSNLKYQTDKPTLVMIVDRLEPTRGEIYEKGAKINLVKFTRHIPGAKSTNYVEGVMQTQIGMQSGAYQPLYYSDFQVYEGANSSVFVVKDKRIYTPKSNIFLGGTRDILVNDLKRELRVVEKDFDLSFLLNADEVFLASSGKEIVPVVKADGNVIGNGKVGKITKLVIKEFREFVNSDRW